MKFPALQRATLKNGTQVILAERHEIPVVQFSYQFPGGFSADQGRKPGTANFTMSLMTEGAGKLGSLAFADAADALPKVLDQAQAEGWTLTQALEHLLRVEVTATDALGASTTLLQACGGSDDEPQRNIVELAQNTPELSILVEAVAAAGLVPTLQGQGPFTVFAPTNAAFAALLAELGVTGLPEHTRREISRRNHGLPLAIRACADELMRLTARIAREQEHVPGETRARRIVAVLDEFDDVAVDGGLLVGGLMTAAAYFVLLERWIAAWVQDRRGPNRVGIPLTNIRLFGLGQPFADGLKIILKEDFTPRHVDRVLYTAAPLLILAASLAIFAAIPFGSVLPPLGIPGLPDPISLLATFFV